ncbi:hypothetical protein R7M47_05335 [Bacillus inaquosorum]|uniref:hypothetical protein n=1 Tax=Bacillus inaquosorum TaxID=483913 RepID=UPI00389A69F8
MAKLQGVKTLDMVNGEITKVSYGGAEYERVEGEAQKGDLVLIKDGWSFATQGKFYVSVGIDEDGDAKIIDNDGDTISNDRSTYELFRKVAAGTNPSVEDRVAKAEGEIESLKSDVAALKGEAEYKRIGKSEARAGDYVKLTSDLYNFTAKDYYEIHFVDSDGDLQITDDEGDNFDTYWLDDSEYEVYRKAGAAEPKPERLKVGDYAKVVGRAIINEKGDIVKIIQDTGGNVPFKVESVSGLYKEWRSEESLVRATDEEVAEAKRAAKWAEIGREVGEYKVGDIFRSPNGNLYEITSIDDRFGYPIGFTDLDGHADRYKRDAAITLVTPVEARFDR